MKLFLFIILTMSGLLAHADLRDVPFHFEIKKLASVHSPLEFFRTFAEYFYLLEQQNHESQNFIQSNWLSSGWCFGDTHFENFGTLLLKSEKSIFTVNDWDDAGPCPVVLDFFRLAVSVKLFSSDIQMNPIYEAYQQGVQGTALQLPNSIQSLISKSEKKGIAPHSKEVKNNRFIRSGESSELTDNEVRDLNKVIVQINLQSQSHFKWIDGIRTIKPDGGSFDLTRYQLLLKDGDQLIHIELKEQMTPSIYPVLRSEKMPTVEEKILKCLQITQASRFSPYYGTIVLGEKSMLIRPRFAGNSSLKASDFSNEELSEIISFEANLLGLLQNKNRVTSLKTNSLNNNDVENLVNDVLQMTNFIKVKFSSLQHK